MIDIDCDIWVPAARPDILHKENIHRLKTKLVAQGANIPLISEAAQDNEGNGVQALGDFLKLQGTFDDRLNKNFYTTIHCVIGRDWPRLPIAHGHDSLGGNPIVN